MDIKDKFQLFLLQRKKEKCIQAYKPYLKKAKKENNRKKLDELLGERSAVCSGFDYEIKTIKTRLLLKKAEKYCVYIPPRNKESWYNDLGYSFLKEEAELEIRKAIRKEEREEKKLWFQGVSLLTGLLGVIVALLSILFMHC